jgi:hypothetical protein
VRVLGVCGDDAAEGLDLEGFLLLGVPPLTHLPAAARWTVFLDGLIIGDSQIGCHLQVID